MTDSAVLPTTSRVRQDTLTGGWVLTCDLCHLREVYYRYWVASRSLEAHREVCE